MAKAKAKAKSSGSKFDFKQFMLQRGEFVGLGVAGAIVVIVLFLAALKGLSSPGSGQNATDLSGKAKSARGKLSNEPPQEWTEGVITLRADLDAKSRTTVETDPFRLALNYFIPKGVEDTKRRGVKVLAPTEFRFKVTRTQLRSYQLQGQPPTHILMLKGAPAAPAAQPGVAIRPGSDVQRAGQMYSQRGIQGMFQGGGPAVPMPTPAGDVQPSSDPNSKVTSLSVPIMEMARHTDKRLAEGIMPVRMAVITGSFPFKKQVDEFMAKLQYRSLSELFADPTSVPTFLGLAVQRVEVDADGKMRLNKDGKPDWQSIELEKSLMKYVLYSGRRFEPEDPELRAIDFPGLVMRRPIQFQANQYPAIEKTLPGIVATLDAFKAAAGPQFKPKNPFTDPEGVDLYNDPGAALPGAMPMDVGGQPFPMPQVNPDGMPVAGQPQAMIPEYCLVRFLDVTVEPGKAYSYQVAVRMRNPNYKRTKDVAWESLAKDPEIRSDFVQVKDDSLPEGQQTRVEVGREAFVYAVDPASDKEYTGVRLKPDPRSQTVVQIHRWMAEVRPDVNDSRSGFQVGDWVIGERLFVNRGEYLVKTDKVEVPTWMTLDEKFGLRQYQKDKKVPVTFSADNGNGDLFLVDFQGGEMTYRKMDVKKDANDNPKGEYTSVPDRAPTELILMSPTGKLLVRDGTADAEDPDRKDRYAAWKARLKSIRDGTAQAGGGNDSPFNK